MEEIGITRMSSRGQIVIPIEMRRDISEGEKLIIVKRDNDLIIKKSIPEMALWSEKSLARTWLNKKEDEAWKDL